MTLRALATTMAIVLVLCVGLVSGSSGVAGFTPGILYVAVLDGVNAYALDGPGGASSPLRTIIPNPGSSQGFTVTGVATSASGMLYIGESVHAPTGATYCGVVVESSTARGLAGAAGRYPCNGAHQQRTWGVARNTVGGYDVLYGDAASRVPSVLRRFGADGTIVSSTLTLDFITAHVATDRNGRDYFTDLNAPGRIVAYDATATSATARASDVTLTNPPQLGAIAISPGPDQTEYVVAIEPPNSFYVHALRIGTSRILRTIGPFGHRVITALAVDSQGNLYVGSYRVGGGSSTGTIQVYGPAANGAPVPDRIIVPNPAINIIYGLAISE